MTTETNVPDAMLSTLEESALDAYAHLVRLTLSIENVRATLERSQYADVAVSLHKTLEWLGSQYAFVVLDYRVKYDRWEAYRRTLDVH